MSFMTDIVCLPWNGGRRWMRAIGLKGQFYNERRVTMLDKLWPVIDWNAMRGILD
jgi:hypothetical protein